MNPGDLIEHAKSLLTSSRGAPPQIRLRRAISAAYYGLFHAIVRFAADEMIGRTAKSRRTPAYALIYRDFTHSDMKAACAEVSKPALPKRYVAACGGMASFPADIQAVANAFVILQERRHRADYDPQYRFTKSDALVAVTMAEYAMGLLDITNRDLTRLFVLLMLATVRQA